jgi:CRP-like cAMP-binding protein
MPRIAARTGNLLLDSLTPEERDALLADAEQRPIPVGQPRRAPGDPIDSVLFPTSGTYSVLVEIGNDRVEAATIGREGAADVYAALASNVATQVLIGQVPGEAVEVPVEVFRKMAQQGPRMQALIYGYLEALFAQAATATACIALHHVNERCARWLLETHDRVDSDTFELKQEFLAVMLAVSRPSVSIAAGTLQASGSIRYRRGTITVVDREALEAASCPCYEIIRSQYSRLVPLGSNSGV